MGKKKEGLKYVLKTIVLWIASSSNSPLSHDEARELCKLIDKEVLNEHT
jgi:hypothetical protein